MMIEARPSHAFSARIVLVLTALLTLTLAVPATADHDRNYPHRDIPPVGASGDASFNDVCRKGGFLIGFQVYLGAWFDNIQMICSDYFPDGTWRPRIPDGGYGGNGGNPTPVVRQCADGWVLEGIALRFTKGTRQVGSLWGNCRRISDGARTGGDFEIAPRDKDVAEFDLRNPPPLNCRSNEAAAGFSGHYGKHVNALGLNCRKFPPDFKVGPSPNKVEPKPEASKVVGMIFCQGGGMTSDIGPNNASLSLRFKRAARSSKLAIPGPGECAFSDRAIRDSEPRELFVRLGAEGQHLVQTGTKGGLFLVSVSRFDLGFWVETVHSVDPNWRPQEGNSREFAKKRAETAKAGEGNGGGAGFAAAAPSFAGTWTSEAGGVTYSMTMKQNGSSVSGSFRGADGSRANFSGKVKDGVLTFSFRQSNGVRGTGRFSIARDGGTFDGRYSVDGDSGAWNGVRRE